MINIENCKIEKIDGAIRITPNDGYTLTQTVNEETVEIDGFMVVPDSRIDEVVPTITAVLKEDTEND